MPLRTALLAALLALAPAADALVIVVDSRTDDGAGCTLREAIEAANTNAPAGGCTTGEPGIDVVQFTVPEVALSAGEIAVADFLQISGPVTITAAPGARILRLTGGGTNLRSFDVRYEGGQADLGGAVFVEDGAGGAFTGGAFVGNVASDMAGAVWVVGTVVFTRTDFTSNRAEGAGGGAIASSDGLVQFNRATFTGNEAPNGSGGAIYSPDEDVVLGTLPRFIDNRAGVDGGAVAVVGNRLELDRPVFSGNHASLSTGGGGAIHASGGAEVTLTGGRVQNGRAAEGGGVWAGPGVTLTVDGTRLEGNFADTDTDTARGGAIYHVGATLTVGGGTTFSANATDMFGIRPPLGGAVYVGAGTATFGDETLFVDNSAASGGALAVVPVAPGGTVDVTLNGVTFQNNDVVDEGGAIYVSGEGASVALVRGFVTGNTTWERGAGVVLLDGAVLTADGTEFSENVVRGLATPVGGAGFLNEGGDATFRDVVFRANDALGLDTIGGAAMLVDGTTRFHAATFEANRAGGAGGAIAVDVLTSFLHEAVVVVDEGTTFVGNQASTYGVPTPNGATGGAISIFHPSSTVTVEDALFEGNLATGRGGALWVREGGALTVRRSTVRDNVAYLGGGLYRELAGETLISGCLFEGNRAWQTGGALALEPYGPTRVENTTIYRNRARFGAGVYATGATATFEGVTIARNVAAVAGGGVLDDEEDRANDLADAARLLVLRGSIVARNSAGNAPFADLAGRLRSGGHNLIGTAPRTAVFPAEPTDQLGTNPRLLPLADNGGPTLTAALAPDSPAIDAGAPGLDVDQRGYARDAQPDAGAFEFGAGPTAAPSVAGLEAPVPGLDVFPNPAAGRATVRLTVEATQRVTVAVYDVTGRRVEALFDGTLEAGEPLEVGLEASKLAAGVYVVVVEGERVRASRRISVVR